MAIDLLQQFFGTNPQLRREYTDFMQRYKDDPRSISDAEAARRYRELLRRAPPELAAEAHAYGFGQLPQGDRRSLAERFRDAAQDPSRPFDGYAYPEPDSAADPANLGHMASQAEQQDPDLLERLVGKDSPLNSPLGRMALAGAAAYLANRVLGQSDLPDLFSSPEGQPPGLNLRERGGPERRV